MPFFKWLFVLATAWFCAGCDSGPAEPEIVRKQVVFFASDRGGGGNMNVWRMDPDGANRVQVTHYAEGDYWPADLSPDGKRLLFYRFDARTLTAAIYEMPVEGPEPSEPLVSGLTTEGSYFPDGERFIYNGYVFPNDTTGHNAVFIYDRRDGSSVQLTPMYAHSYQPRVSPDGTQVCYSVLTRRDYWGRINRLFVMDLTQHTSVALSPDDARVTYEGECVFSPDGRRVFFVMTFDLHWVDLATGELHAIPRLGRDSHPYPDTSGTRLFFRANGGTEPDSLSEIMSVSLDGSGLTRLTTDTYRDDRPVVAVVDVLE